MRIGLKRIKQRGGNCRYLLDGPQKCGLVGLGWFVETSDLSHELKRCRPDFVIRHRRFKIEKLFDISAHGGRRWLGGN